MNTLNIITTLFSLYLMLGIIILTSILVIFDKDYISIRQVLLWPLTLIKILQWKK